MGPNYNSAAKYADQWCGARGCGIRSAYLGVQASLPLRYRPDLSRGFIPGQCLSVLVFALGRLQRIRSALSRSTATPPLGECELTRPASRPPDSAPRTALGSARACRSASWSRPAKLRHKPPFGYVCELSGVNWVSEVGCGRRCPCFTAFAARCTWSRARSSGRMAHGA